MKVVGVIPARYKSTRFEGKPLADICGKPMIWWVYQQVKTVKKLMPTKKVLYCFVSTTMGRKFKKKEIDNLYFLENYKRKCLLVHLGSILLDIQKDLTKRELTIEKIFIPPYENFRNYFKENRID